MTFASLVALTGNLAAFDLHLKLSGVSMGRLYALSGIVLPETPPFATEGHLTGTLGARGGHWVYEKFSGKVGSSDTSAHELVNIPP